MTNPAVAGIDVGGSTIKAVLRDGAGTLLARLAVPTPRDDADGLRTVEAVAALVQQLGERAAVSAVGLSVPGVVDPVSGRCRRSVNLGWVDLPIRDLVGGRLGLPVVLAHDVRAGALAEKVSGAGRGRSGPMVFMPVGTGLAIAVVDDLGASQGPFAAGEVGQVRLVDGLHAGLPAGARVEDVASARGIARRAGMVDAERVALAAAAGETDAGRVWAEGVALLADVVAWTIAVVGPTVVVVGGGLAEAGALLFEPLQARVRERVPDLDVPLLAAEHGTGAGAEGAARLARRLVDAGAERRA